MICSPTLASISIVALGIFTSVGKTSHHAISAFSPTTTASTAVKTSVMKKLRPNATNKDNQHNKSFIQFDGYTHTTIDMGLHMSSSWPSSTSTTSTPIDEEEEESKEEVDLLEPDSNGIYTLKNKEDHM